MRNKSKLGSQGEDLLMMMQRSIDQQEQIRSLSIHSPNKLPPLLPPRHLLAQQLTMATRQFGDNLVQGLNNAPSVCQISFDKDARRVRKYRDKYRNQSLMSSIKQQPRQKNHTHFKSEHSQSLSVPKERRIDKNLTLNEQETPPRLLNRETYYRAQARLQTPIVKQEEQQQLQESIKSQQSGSKMLNISKYGTYNPQTELFKDMIKSQNVDRQQQRLHIKRRTMNRFQRTMMGNYGPQKDTHCVNKVKQQMFEPWKLEVAEEQAEELLIK